jgi:hypothetical protein
VPVDPERIKNWSGRTSRVSTPGVSWSHLHDDYEVAPGDRILSDTGRLEVLKFVPKAGDGPVFVARWDNHAETLDSDMCRASDAAQADFKREQKGYRAHHPTRAADPNTRTFSIRIESPEHGLIFEGEFSFSNTFDVRAAPMHGEGNMTS